MAASLHARSHALPGPLINKTYATQKLATSYPHVGLLDVSVRELWIAKKKLGMDPSRVSHARLLASGNGSTASADKDRFLCYWYHHPDNAPQQTLGSVATASMSVHGYPIEWNEAHLLVRLDPNWDIGKQELIKSTDTRKIDRNIDQQYAWGELIFRHYAGLKKEHPISWHLIGPRAKDSLFYVERAE